MGKRLASAVLPTASERELRRLRFADPDLEAAFLDAYAQKSRLHLRAVLGITLIIPGVSSIADLLRAPSPSVPQFPWTLAIHLAALLLTWSSWFRRLFQPLLAVLCLVAPLSLLVAMLPAEEGYHVLLVASLYTYTLYRLRFLLAVLVYWSLIAFYVGYSHWVLHTPLADVTGLVVVNLLGMLAAYTLEHWSRRDFLLTRLLEEERGKSERLLLNILPEVIAERLKLEPGTVADSFPDVTVLFADIVDFTPLAERLSAEDTVALLNQVFSCFDGLADKHGLEKIKTVGDAYMVVGGLPAPCADHAGSVLAMALDMQREIGRFHRDTGEPLGLRIGINTGPVVAGVIGTRKFIYDLWGDTVNLASRMETYGVAGGIQVTPAAYERLCDRYAFTPRMLDHVKGKGPMTAYLLDQPACGLPQSTPCSP